MEHLIVLLLTLLEDGLRPRLKDVIPGADDLVADPVGYLADRDGVHVGPRRYPVVAVLSAVPSGLFGAMLGYGLDLAAGTSLFLLPGAAAGALLVPFLVYRLNRGGELHLVPAGVVFSYGPKDVVCPWGVFDPRRPATKTDATWWRVPVRPDELARVALLVRGDVKRTGRDVRTTHFWVSKPNVFRRLFGAPPDGPDAVSVRDCYAARADELYSLILSIAPRMAAAEADRADAGDPARVTPRS